MPSKGCYVYMTLPGQIEAVVCGYFEIRDGRDGSQVGRFIYGKSYLDRADRVEIDPIRLNRLVGQAVDYAGTSPVFPALRDASPDAWGRLLIDREMGGQPDEIEYLLHSPDDRAGALGFGNAPIPPAPKREFNKTLQLKALMDISDEILKGEPLKDTPEVRQIQRLQLVGTSMGGARPKTVVEDDDGVLWLAKFSRPDDAFDNPRVEHAMLLLAGECGLSPAQSKVVTVGDRPALLVKRFDREKVENGYLRHRMISAVTVLDASDSSTDRARWSYPLLADELRRLDIDQANSRRSLLRRMTFNALISNVDDHPRNHALIADERGWRLSPTYDVVPTPLVALDGRSLAMQVGAHGRSPTKVNILSECGRFGLRMAEAADIVDELYDLISERWYPLCRQSGVKESDCKTIRNAFTYPGFDWDRRDVPDENHEPFLS